MAKRNERLVLVLYFMLGFALEYPILCIKLWLAESYGLSIPAVGAILSTVGIPWTLKPVYGAISDNFPIAGRRRKPYIILCNLGASMLWVVLASSRHSVTGVTTILILISLLTCFADVLYDATMVEMTKDEEGDSKGSYQSLCWVCRAAGAFSAALAGGYMLERITPIQVFYVESTLPLMVALVTACVMYEPRSARRVTRASKVAESELWANARKIWEAFRSPSLWKPALFVCLFCVTPGSGNAWFYYLVKKHDFTPHLMGALACVRHGSHLVGALVYRRWLRGVEFRTFFVVLVMVSSLLSLTPLLLYYEVNQTLGIPDFFFVAGDDVFLAALGQIAMMPCLILVAKLCPPGVEASLYATFVAMMNLSGIASEYLGSVLTLGMGVTYTDFGNLPELIVVCAATSLLPLALVKFLPRGNVQQLGGRTKIAEAQTELDEKYLNELVGLI